MRYIFIDFYLPKATLPYNQWEKEFKENNFLFEIKYIPPELLPNIGEHVVDEYQTKILNIYKFLKNDVIVYLCGPIDTTDTNHFLNLQDIENLQKYFGF